jgi:cytochrome c553
MPYERSIPRRSFPPVARSGSHWHGLPNPAHASRDDSPARAADEVIRSSKMVSPRCRFVPLMIALAVLLPTGAAAQAGDVAAGRRKALQCQACHGLDGLSKLPEAPHLAGQPEHYLIKSIDEYRTGARRHDMMTLVATNLSDQDIADLAAYYAAIEISAVPPR